MPSNNTWAETALVACAAAGFASFVLMQLMKRDDDKKRDDYPYPYAATFLQNMRSRNPGDDQVALQDQKGWSMEDAMNSAESAGAKAKSMSPEEVLQSLQKGNSRFYTGRATRPEVSAFERRTLIKQQFPSTAILGCSDSRVPVEIIFDQGLGDMFVVRVAGNCLGMTTEASLHYAVNHLNVKVVIVMGHEGCGAIKAAGLPNELIDQEPPALASALKGLKAGLNEEHLCQICDPRARDREAVASNVRHQVKKLTKDQKILDQVNNGSLIIVGAFYEISSGIVDFFMEVSKDTGGDFKPLPGVMNRYNPKTEKIVD